MNDRLNQLKNAAENVSKNNPEKFSEIYGLLIYKDCIKLLSQLKNEMPDEVSCTFDGVDSWQMAIATMEIKLNNFFSVK